jgi:NarL family two-component system response regulator LiaR
MTDRIKVLVVDDHLIVRVGLRWLLTPEPDIEIVGEAVDGVEAVAAALRLEPDVILMDLVMPRMDGIAAIAQITAQQPGARILVLSSFETDDKVFPAIRAGALGYTLKELGPEDLVRAIRRVNRGESSLHPTIARRVLHELAHPPQQLLTADPLTEREVEVLRLIAHGLSNQEIAATLALSEITVRGRVSCILSKLHLASRTQAALYALRQGLASLAADKP